MKPRRHTQPAISHTSAFAMLAGALCCLAFTANQAWGAGATYTWNNSNGTTNANSATNWTPNWSLFTNPEDVANFTNNITANVNADLSTDTTVGIINVGDSNGSNTFSLRTPVATPTAKFILDNGMANAQLNQVSTSKGDTLSALYTIAGTGVLDVTNASTAALNMGSNSVAAGTINLLGGTVNASHNNAFGSCTVNLGAPSVATAATLTANTLTVALPINLTASHTGTLTLGTSGNNAAIFGGGVVLNGHALNLNGGSGSGTVTVAAISGTADVTTTTGAATATVGLSNTNAGWTGNLIVGGLGVTQVTTAQTFIGNINVNSGTFRGAASGQTLPTATIVTLANGTTYEDAVNSTHTTGGSFAAITAGDSVTIRSTSGGLNGGRVTYIGTGITGVTANPITLNNLTAGTGATLNFELTGGSGCGITAGTLAIGTGLSSDAVTLSAVVTSGNQTRGSFTTLGSTGGAVNNLGTFSATPSLSGAGTLNKTGGGMLSLAGNSPAFSGLINVNAGTVRVNNQTNVMGTASTAMNVATGAGVDFVEIMTAAQLGQISFAASGAVERWSKDGARIGTTTSYTVPADRILQLASNQSGGRTITLSAGSTLQMFVGGANASSLGTYRTMSGAMGVALAGAANIGQSGTLTGNVDMKPNDTLSTVLDKFSVPSTSAYTSRNTLEIIGAITGGAGNSLTKIGPDALVLRSTSNTYSGETIVNGGVLGISAANATSPNSLLNVGPSGTFDLSNGFCYSVASGLNSFPAPTTGFTSARNAFNTTVAGLTGSGTITNTGAAAALPTNAVKDTNSTTTNTLTTNVATGTQTFSGTIKDGSYVITGRVGDGTGSAVATSTSNGILALAKSGNGTQILSGPNTYTGTTTLNSGALLIDGEQALATGPITVKATGLLGGNGSSGAAVTMESGGGFSAQITDWTGSAGTGYKDLAVASVDAASAPITVTIDTTGMVNFTDTAKSFTIVNTTGGVTNLVPATVTINAPGFPGTGSWSLASISGALVLSYAPAGGTGYNNWANDPGKGNIPGEPATGDYDKDGLTNLMEYGLGLDPKVASSSPGSIVGNLVTFTKGPDAKNDTAITFIIEQSTNLVLWNEVVSDNTPANSTVSYTLTTLPKDFARLTIKQN